MWRNGQALRPYFEDVKFISRNRFFLKNNSNCLHEILEEDAYKFVHFPIKDCSVTDDKGVLELCCSLVEAIAAKEVLYIHCWGGHGRTGTIVSIMLHLMYDVSGRVYSKFTFLEALITLHELC